MIWEGIITTGADADTAHTTPMGFRRVGRQVLVQPFVPSRTLNNLKQHGYACISFSDDVRVTAGCLTGRFEWPLAAAGNAKCWRLRDCLSHLELSLSRVEPDAERPRFYLDITGEYNHRPFQGFNRAQGAVIEAAILVSRLDFIESEKLVHEMRYLDIAIGKTAGHNEMTAWRWLVQAIAEHPRSFPPLEVTT